ncbi:MAG: hypothetical protein ACYC4E_02285, partial [Carboxydocellales bacterium]
NAAVKISRLAVDTGVFPLYEVENGVNYTINRGHQGLPVSTYLSKQSRYKHLNQGQTDEIQREVNYQWEYLQKRAKI